ncbi:hypothetical protein T4A_725 [Trichinella pseudospiralis]|uniref:Uncharacterized protein n=1 Tax=Trichinella pseudospiralis TaxID=6337 RepID=A0A0V1DTW0_TRIPS|nr:hypothetical protein T4A_725 [Trichinella pseudospiralis]
MHFVCGVHKPADQPAVEYEQADVSIATCIQHIQNEITTKRLILRSKVELTRSIEYSNQHINRPWNTNKRTSPPPIRKMLLTCPQKFAPIFVIGCLLIGCMAIDQL